jgi:hypothetical protein
MEEIRTATIAHYRQNRIELMAFAPALGLSLEQVLGRIRPPQLPA